MSDTSTNSQQTQTKFAGSPPDSPGQTAVDTQSSPSIEIVPIWSLINGDLLIRIGQPKEDPEVLLIAADHYFSAAVSAGTEEQLRARDGLARQIQKLYEDEADEAKKKHQERQRQHLIQQIDGLPMTPQLREIHLQNGWDSSPVRFVIEDLLGKSVTKALTEGHSFSGINLSITPEIRAKWDRALQIARVYGSNNRNKLSMAHLRRELESDEQIEMNTVE